LPIADLKEDQASESRKNAGSNAKQIDNRKSAMLSLVFRPSISWLDEFALLSSVKTTKPDHDGQALNRCGDHPEFLGGFVLFGLWLVAGASLIQCYSASTLSADVTLSSLRRNRN
jgi:hypothetical protein